MCRVGGVRVLVSPSPCPSVRSGFVAPPHLSATLWPPWVFFSARPCVSSLCANPEPCPAARTLTSHDVPLKKFLEKKCFMFSVFFST